MIHGSARRSLALLASVIFVAGACSSGSSPAPSTGGGGGASASTGKIGGTVTVIGTWTGDEQTTFLSIVAPFEQQTGVKVQYTGTRDINTLLANGIKAGGSTLPDVAGLPGPGQMAEYAASGALKDLTSVIDVAKYSSGVGSFADLGKTSDGKLVGVFMKVSPKGFIWYDPKVVGDLASNPPKTWDDLQTLITQNKSKAQAAWCVGLESGAASGWPGTDWIEDFILRQAGPDTYTKWYQGKVKWTDPAIKKAWQSFGDVLKASYGGSNYVLSTNFANGGDKLFSSPPGCLFHHQANFITTNGAFTKLKAGTDYDFFAFPDVNSQYSGAIEAGGDIVGMFHDTPQAKALMQWLVTPDAQAIGVKNPKGGFISANKQVPLTDYASAVDKKTAQALQNAKTVVFDGSDNMPLQMNAEFWTSILNFTKDQSKLDSILAHLDGIQSSSYGGS